MFILKYKSFFLGFSVVMLSAALLVTLLFGLKPGIDFTGGSSVQVEYVGEVPLAADVQKLIKESGLGESTVQPVGVKGYTIKLKDLNAQERELLKSAMSIDGEFQYQEKSFTSIGPSIGRELTQKAIIAILIVIVCIVLFIAFSFRAVSLPVASWKYGLIAITTLAHDIILPIGLFAILGHFHGAEIDALFVIALLTILGISISDTIVIFDRIRENLKNKVGATFEETVGKSLSQSFARSLNTSVTVLFVLFALYLFGPATTKNFSLVLITGMIVGTYSSIFVASPLLVITEKLQHKKKK